MISQSRNAGEALQQAKRYERAKQILAEGYTFHKDADAEAIAVCKPGSTAATYWINLLTPGCDCPDRLQTGKECKHELAYAVLQAEKTEDANMWESICKQWEDQNLPLFPELTKAPQTLTVGMVLEALQARIMQDMDIAEAQMLKRDIQPPAIRYDRQRRFQNLQGALDVIANYQTKEEAGLLNLTPAELVTL